MSITDYYKELGITINASDREVKVAYRKLAMKHHPDHNVGDDVAEDKFRKINDAYRSIKKFKTENKTTFEDSKESNNFKSAGAINYYEVLGITISASNRTIERAYKKMLDRYKPIAQRGNEKARKKLEEINEAYEFLIDDREQDPNVW